MLRSIGILLIGFAGVGRIDPNKASNILGFRLTAGEKKDLVAFIERLIDEECLEDPRLSNPRKR